MEWVCGMQRIPMLIKKTPSTVLFQVKKSVLNFHFICGCKLWYNISHKTYFIACCFIYGSTMLTNHYLCFHIQITILQIQN